MNSLPSQLRAQEKLELASTAYAFAESAQRTACSFTNRQRGVVLFFTLVALLAMSLAAVALIRSVDTSAMITGNLAVKQMVTASADFGVEDAINKLFTINQASALDVETDPTHPFNQTNLVANPGYYASLDPALDMTADSTWSGANKAVPLGTDSSGNQLSYIIQRMCRTPGVAKNDADCLLALAASNNNAQSVVSAPYQCPNGQCLPGTQPAQMRVTVRSVGIKNSTSYVQVFIY